MLRNQQWSLVDPGLGLAGESANGILVFATKSAHDSGTASVGDIVSVTSPSGAVAALGNSPAAEIAAFAAKNGVSPVLVCLTDCTESEYDSESVTDDGYSITLDGYANRDCELHVWVTKAGAVGTSRFRFSLDGAQTWSDERLTVAEFEIPGIGLTASFTGSYPLDARFITVIDGPKIDGLADAVAVVREYSGTVPEIVAVYDGQLTAANANTLITQCGSEALSLASALTFTVWFVDGGSADTAATVASTVTAASKNVCAVYDTQRIVTAMPGEGYGVPAVSGLISAVTHVGRQLISTDPGRQRSGGVAGVVSISHNEATATDVLHDKGITTFRTYRHQRGYYINQGSMRSPPGSDVKYVQHARLLARAENIVAKHQQSFMGMAVRALTDGTGRIDPRDAARLQAEVQNQLDLEFVTQRNAEGTKGHVSSIDFVLDTENNIISSGTLQTEIIIVPLGYVDAIRSQIGFSLKGSN